LRLFSSLSFSAIHILDTRLLQGPPCIHTTLMLRCQTYSLRVSPRRRWRYRDVQWDKGFTDTYPRQHQLTHLLSKFPPPRPSRFSRSAFVFSLCPPSSFEGWPDGAILPREDTLAGYRVHPPPLMRPTTPTLFRFFFFFFLFCVTPLPNDPRSFFFFYCPKVVSRSLFIRRSTAPNRL